MSSLEVINKTLHGIREDTDELNRNFLKFFLEQQRGKLDAEEDRRERAKMMAALGAAAAGARLGGGGGGRQSQSQDDGGGLNPLKFITDLVKKYPWLVGGALGLGVYKVGKTVVKAGVGTYRAATAPARWGNKMGQAAIRVAERARQRMELERMRKASLAFGDVESAADAEAENARKARREKLRLEILEKNRINSLGLADIENMADDATAKAKAKRALQLSKTYSGRGGFLEIPRGSMPGAKNFLPLPRGTSYTPSVPMGGGGGTTDPLPKVLIQGNKVSYLDPVTNRFMPHQIARPILEANGFSALGEDLRADLEEVRNAERERIKQAKAVAERAKTPNTPAKTLDQIVAEARAERARVAANIAKKAGGTIKGAGFGALAAAGKTSPILYGVDAGLKAGELQDEGVSIGASSVVALGTSGTIGLADFANWLTNFGLRAFGSDYQLRTDMASSTNKGIFNFLRNNMEYVPPEFRKFLFKKEELDNLNKPYVPNKVVPMDSSLMIPQVSAEDEANAKAIAAAEAQLVAAQLLENAAIAMGKNSDGRIVTKGDATSLPPIGSTVDLRANKLNMMVGGGGMFMIPDMIMPTI